MLLVVKKQNVGVEGEVCSTPPSAGDSTEPVSSRRLQFQVTEYPTRNGLNSNGAFYDPSRNPGLASSVA